MVNDFFFGVNYPFNYAKDRKEVLWWHETYICILNHLLQNDMQDLIYFLRKSVQRFHDIEILCNEDSFVIVPLQMYRKPMQLNLYSSAENDEYFIFIKILSHFGQWPAVCVYLFKML